MVFTIPDWLKYNHHTFKPILSNHVFNFGAILSFLFLTWLFYSAVSLVLDNLFIKTGIIWSLTDDDEFTNTLSIGISAFVVAFSFISNLILLGISSGVLYFTLKETYTAKDLMSRIKTIKAKE